MNWNELILETESTPFLLSMNSNHRSSHLRLRDHLSILSSHPAHTWDWVVRDCVQVRKDRRFCPPAASSGPLRRWAASWATSATRTTATIRSSPPVETSRPTDVWRDADGGKVILGSQLVDRLIFSFLGSFSAMRQTEEGWHCRRHTLATESWCEWDFDNPIVTF